MIFPERERGKYDNLGTHVVNIVCHGHKCNILYVSLVRICWSFVYCCRYCWVFVWFLLLLFSSHLYIYAVGNKSSLTEVRRAQRVTLHGEGYTERCTMLYLINCWWNVSWKEKHWSSTRWAKWFRWCHVVPWHTLSVFHLTPLWMDPSTWNCSKRSWNCTCASTAAQFSCKMAPLVTDQR